MSSTDAQAIEKRRIPIEVRAVDGDELMDATGGYLPGGPQIDPEWTGVVPFRTPGTADDGGGREALAEVYVMPTRTEDGEKAAADELKPAPPGTLPAIDRSMPRSLWPSS